MKYALVFVVVAVGFWLWLRNRSARPRDQVNTPVRKPSVKNQIAAEMISCSVCGLHLPSAEALIGKQGLYCSAEHKHQGGD